MPEHRTALDESGKIRKERVHTTMLVELLVTLVFLAMAFAFVQKDELSVSVLQQQVKDLTAQLADARASSRKLERENHDLLRINRELRDSLARWMDRPRTSLPASEQPIVLPRGELTDLQDKLANALAMLKESQKENAELRKKLIGPGKGGTDLPNCTVSAGFLLNIELLGSGSFKVAPSWAPGAEAAARSVDGISELVTAGEVDPTTFGIGSAKAAAWGLKQTVRCRFRVRAVERHADLDLYKRQLASIEQYFYAKRN